MLAVKNILAAVKSCPSCNNNKIISPSSVSAFLVPSKNTSINHVRSFVSTPTLQMGLEEFRDSVSREERGKERVGRSWGVDELRRKSFEDLHKLWYVLYKERNMILTEKQLSRRNGIVFPQQERQKKVQKSMAAIKVVLGERKRHAISQHALKMAMKEEAESLDEASDEAK